MNRAEEIAFPHDEEPEGISHAFHIAHEWHSDYKHSLKNIEALSHYIPLKAREKLLLRQIIKTYHMRIPLYYLSLMQEPSNPLDPIRRQCIPAIEELCEGDHESIDPLGEEMTSPTACMVHRYPDRVLLLVTNHCFMYCRHCTRKRLWKTENFVPTLSDIEQAMGYVRRNEQIREVIVSGGDPLTLPTERLDRILSTIASIPHVEVIRIGTRAPVVLPQRIDEGLCRALEKYEHLWINVQFNHPWEVTPEAISACRKLQRCGIPLSNQSVLLKGINDDTQVMTELCHKLQSIRVRPYYLFQCDPVVGASHFRTSLFKGVEVIEKMRGHTSGMCVPTFVVDGIDGKGKVPLAPNYLMSVTSEGVLLRNYNNQTFFYENPTE